MRYLFLLLLVVAFVPITYQISQAKQVSFSVIFYLLFHSKDLTSKKLTPLNDTGVNFGADLDNTYNHCFGVEISQQDCSNGRDVTHNDLKDGHAGFNFTKLDSNGYPLQNQNVDYESTSWSCVRDNVTGLTWEVKTTDDGLHDNRKRYSWYNTDASSNGGHSGWPHGRNTNTQTYVRLVNDENFCGGKGWRMPTVDELLSITSFGHRSPAIDSNYFPNTKTLYWYWSATPHAMYPTVAWEVDFYDGIISWDESSNDKYVRLVRDY